MSSEIKPFTTFLLRKGAFSLKGSLGFTKSVQVIGIEDGVEIDIGPFFQIPHPCYTATHGTIYVHFERIFFVKGGSQIKVGKTGFGSFYLCLFSNGKECCQAFPKCQGEMGCLNPSKCKRQLDINRRLGFFASAPSGEAGQPGIYAGGGGKVYIDNCLIDRCGGGGVLSINTDSFLLISNSTVRNMRQMGIEARDGGAITAINNKIIDNRFHGVAIGPKGIGYLMANYIHGNGSEGVWCGGVCDQEYNSDEGALNFIKGSNAVIVDNVISQNGLSGISLDGGNFEVKGNKIFDNWLWGIMVKSSSSSYVLNNEIFENKCGGIRIGINYSASVVIDGNTIRDHLGPDIYALHIVGQMTEMSVDGEIKAYTRPPIITSTNVRRNNEKGIQHPQHVVSLIKTCCYCRNGAKSLKRCGKCKKALYCSKECQENHWKRHKHMCKFLKSAYTIEIKMKDTKSVMFGYNFKIRIFDRKLKGIMKGTPPDRNSSNLFIVKIQSGKEYGEYDPYKIIRVYDQSVSLDIEFSNPTLYHLCCECGVLGAINLATKKIFCWASFKDNGDTLCFHTDNLPPYQTW